MQFIHYSFVSTTKDNHELFYGHSSVPMSGPGDGTGPSEDPFPSRLQNRRRCPRHRGARGRHDF